MSQRLDVNMSDSANYPDWDVWIAAVLRQLLRARDSDDWVAQWLATNSFCSILCQILTDLLEREPSWDSNNRWIDCLDQRELMQISADRVQVSGAIWWNVHADTGGGGSEPFEADLVFSAGMAELVAHTIRFKDQRGFAAASLKESAARCRRDLDAGTVEWAFVFNRQCETASQG
jgi:hypothetical protein